MIETGPHRRLGRRAGWWLGVAAYIVVFAVQAAATRAVFTQAHPGANDLYPRWAGGCAWLLQGDNPYSPATTEAIQKGIFGRPALPGEDQAAFAYPIYVVLFTWPLCLTNDFSIVQAVWMTALIHLLVVAAVLARRLSGWSPSARLWPWVLAWAVLVYPNSRAVLLGQLAVVVAALILGSLYALKLRRDVVAGIVLALTTIKPQMILLFVPWVVVWAAAQGRWRVVVAFAASLAAFAAIPLIWLPSWPADFLRQLNAYTSYTELGSVTWILTSYYAHWPPAVEIAVSALFLAWLAWEGYRSRSMDLPSMLWAASLTLVITHFVSPRTATTHFAPLMLPLFMGFALMARRWGSRATPAIASILLLVLMGTWVLFLMTVQGNQESALTYLPIPVFLVVLLPMMKGAWLRAQRPAVVDSL